MDHPNQALMLCDFSFDVPERLIAQQPLTQRDDSKLLIWDGQSITHGQVRRLCDAVPKDTLFILNDSRVIASRLHGKLKTGGAVELLLLEPCGDDRGELWLALGKPMKKLLVGTDIYFASGLSAKVTAIRPPSDSGPQPFEVKLSLIGSDLLAWLDQHGEMPLPPYISRKNQTDTTRSLDKSRYQTVYAQSRESVVRTKTGKDETLGATLGSTVEGSVAAPTAGLHFSNQVISSLKDHGCSFAHVTLHVGAGTFLPVKTSDPAAHIMHSERYMVPRSTLQAIMDAKKNGRKIIAVGTTALRSLEGLCRQSRQQSKPISELTDQWLRTDIFIRPEFKSSRHRPQLCDGIMTNFHQPESTLFMLICALIGFDQAHTIYREAISQDYRFFSYGDSSLLWFGHID
jgi:S-adenosylmethionine:tRNA ribosyltransferase-isomerase